MTDWPPWFEELLRRHLRYLTSERQLEADDSLAELGVDSLSLIRLLVDMEDDFDVILPTEAITSRTFATPASLWLVVSATLSPS